MRTKNERMDLMPVWALPQSRNVGGTQSVEAFTVTSAAQVDVADVIADGAIAITGTNIDLNSGTYTSNNNSLTFTGAVALESSGALTITSGGGGGNDIIFTSTIEDTTNDSDLDLVAGAGAVDVQGITGAGSQLSSFTVTSAATVDVENVTADGNIDITGTTINLNSTAYTSNNDDVRLTGAVELAAGAATTTLSSGAGAGDDIVITGTVDDATTNDTTLDLIAGLGIATVTGNVGGTQSVEAFTVTSAAQAGGGGCD